MAPGASAGETGFTGKVALVTGASRGIGEAVARGLAAAGARVVLASRRQEAVDRVAAAIGEAGGEALAVAAHTGRAADVAALVRRTVEAFGGVDVLVNNAATNPHYGPILTSEEGHWDKTYEVNVKGYFHLARECVPSMRERGGGKIVNIASIAGIRPMAGLGVYSVSKAAVLMLTRILAQELAGDNIQVNALAPGLIKTAFSRALWEDPKTLGRIEKKIPAGRLGDPEDLVGAVLYFAGPASDLTTGAILEIDGGLGIGSV